MNTLVRLTSRFASIAFVAMLANCSAVTDQVRPIGAALKPRPPDCNIEILDKNTDKPHRVVAEIDAYVRRNKLTGGLRGVLDEAIPELKKQGCAAGADAVVVLNQTVSQSGEFKLLYVKAVAIHFEIPPGS
jgi:hypothetical protein